MDSSGSHELSHAHNHPQHTCLTTQVTTVVLPCPTPNSCWTAGLIVPIGAIPTGQHIGQHRTCQRVVLSRMNRTHRTQFRSDISDSRFRRHDVSGHERTLNRTFTGHSPDITGHYRTNRTTGHPGLSLLDDRLTLSSRSSATTSSSASLPTSEL